MNKKCNGCKRELEKELFMRKDKEHSRCNDCSAKSSCKKNICKTCGIKALYNYENFSDGIYCNSHKEPGMIDVKNKKCKYEECTKRPNFNFEGENKGLYCNSHKEDGMVDITHKKCNYEECNKRPNFNFEGENKGLYCNSHKEPGMIDVKNKKCKYEECT
jgi:hypothetical protein